mmetsp:Transcript_1054/g.1888  ORF Transcript_1054/g.1888 Transcript_1054/m.1888 type:complete len:110 (-) Transcript_1054:71-400(-)
MAQDSQRNQLLESGQKIRQAKESVQASTKAALETEQVGFQVLSDLARQREVIDRTKVHVSEIDSNITGARRVLLQMNRRALMKRATMWILAAVLAMTLIAVIYHLFMKK